MAPVTATLDSILAHDRRCKAAHAARLHVAVRASSDAVKMTRQILTQRLYPRSPSLGTLDAHRASPQLTQPWQDFELEGLRRCRAAGAATVGSAGGETGDDGLVRAATSGGVVDCRAAYT
eukprot:1135387-Pleurochrysis_carterae.AAC.1